MDPSTLLPDTTDPLLEPHWTGLREGRLLAQRCDDCQYLRWPPAPICPECLSPASDWTELAPRGSLWSFTVYHRALHPAFRDQIPYAVGLVELDDQPRMIGRLAVDESDLEIGMRVRAVFRAVSPAVTIVEWVAEEGR